MIGVDECELVETEPVGPAKADGLWNAKRLQAPVCVYKRCAACIRVSGASNV